MASQAKGAAWAARDGVRAAWGLATGLVLATTLAGVANAQGAAVFDLPAAPVDDALVRFAVQANVSIGGLQAGACRGLSRPVRGPQSPASALARLLPPGCDFVQVDSRTFRIVAAPPPRPQALAPPAAASTPVEELVVTAERRRETLRGNPYAVSVIGGRDLARLGADSFSQAAGQFAGVAETNLGPGRDKIFIRGLSDGAFTGRTQSTVGLYLDDVPISYNAPDPNLLLADVARVEVLRGPQGTLYGSGSIGGIVRIVTVAPDPDAETVEAKVQATSELRDNFGGGVVAIMNRPLGDGAAIRLVGYADQAPGYLDNLRLDKRNVNRSTRVGGRVGLFAPFGDGWDGLATLAAQETRTRDSQYVQIGRSERTARVREPHDNTFLMADARAHRSGGAFDVTASTAFIYHDLVTRYDATGTFDLGRRDLASFREAQRFRLWVAEASATSVGSGPWQWIAGGFASTSREAYSGLLDARASEGPVRPVFVRRDRIGEGALFGELTYQPAPRVAVTAGARAFVTRVHSRAGNFGVATDPLPSMDHAVTEGGIAPKLRVSYAFGHGDVLYAQAQDGYRAGGFNVPALADGVPGGPDSPMFHPDRLHSYEIGTQLNLLEDRLTLRAAVFKAVWRNVQTDQFRTSGLPLTVNIGNGSNTGLEVEADWRPAPGWRLRLNGLFDDPQLTRSRDVFPARVDVGLPGVAKVTAGADLGYTWTPWSGWTAEVSGQATYVGRSLVTFDGGTATEMGGYSEGRLSALLQTDGWAIQALVRNVANNSGNTFAYGNPFSHRRARQATPLPPRTFVLSVTRRY